MSTLGKVCLSLTLLLLLMAVAPIPGKFGGWGPKLLVAHNQWSEKLRSAKTKAAEAMAAEQEARLERDASLADIESLTIGWDQYWIVPPRGPNNAPNAPSLEKQAGRLAVRNIGSRNGLNTSTVKDESGADQTLSPVVHAFYSSAEGFTYAGEFIASDIREDGAVLTPVRPPSPQEFNAWPDNGTWRLRTLIPSAFRASVDEWYVHRMRTKQLYDQAEANIGRQQALLKSAQDALDVRKKELLGDPSRPPVPNRPEFTVGLLQAIEDTEEERNQLQLNVDELRRSINQEILQRSLQLEALTQQTAQLPAAIVE